VTDPFSSGSQGPEPSPYELAEYGRLCDEILARLSIDMDLLDRLFQAAGFCATVAGLLLTVGGAWITIGIQLIGASISLLCCPIVLTFLAGMQSENDLRRGQITWHIRTRHEERHMPDGWESRRHAIFKARPWVLCKQARSRYHELAPLKGLKVLSMRGLFITIQVLFLGAGAACGYVGLQHMPNPLLIDFVGCLFVIALSLTLLTCFTIQHRRHRDATMPGNHSESNADEPEELDLEDDEHPFAPAHKGIEIIQ
jgi:hypothetical protein